MRHISPEDHLSRLARLRPSCKDPRQLSFLLGYDFSSKRVNVRDKMRQNFLQQVLRDLNVVTVIGSQVLCTAMNHERQIR